MSDSASVCAKINLSLCIEGKRGDMHTLDMIVVPYKKYCDSATVTLDKSVSGLVLSQIDTSLDNIDKSRFASALGDKLDAISKYYNINGYVSINKGVPLGAGLGGSTASIVAVVKAVEKIVAKRADTQFLISLGSDVPCMYLGKPCRVQGVGEIVKELQPDCTFDVIDYLVEGGVDSAKAYRAFDEWYNSLSDKQQEQFENSAIPTSVSEAIALLRNDLQGVAQTLNENIAKKLATLEGRLMMTGSGSTIIKIQNFKKFEN